MNKDHVIAAQLSSVHSPAEKLEPNYVYQYVGEIVDQVPLDILVLGWEERPSLFKALTSKEKRLSKEVFLWYPFLSDYPEVQCSHLVVNIDSGKSEGWGGYDGTGIKETFKQACPNNPEAFDVSMEHLEYLLTTYDFDGVFIDKIRFPSMANGLRDVLSCFCPYCIEKAFKEGLDLNEVKAILQEKHWITKQNSPANIPPGATWLEILTKDLPLIQQFIRFRADSVNLIVSQIAATVNKLGKKMSLDVFSPGLAPLVGQDFELMGQIAAWVKPMIYRFGNGPSSLRSEIPALVRELGSYLGAENHEVMDWVNKHIEGLDSVSLEEIEKVAPLSLLGAETQKAVRLLSGTQVYLGLETVSIPKMMTITPRNVEEILEIGEAAGVQGYVLSWDLLHTPLENVLPLKCL